MAGCSANYGSAAAAASSVAGRVNRSARSGATNALPRATRSLPLSLPPGRTETATSRSLQSLIGYLLR